MKLVSVLFRKVATNNIIRKSDPNLMAAWQISKYGVEKCLLECSRDVAIPAIKKPDDILIEIKAASLNALDLRMKEGYGSKIIEVARKLDQRAFFGVKNTLPLILGRDCSGIVVDKGRNVDKVKLGDEVIYTCLFRRNGADRQQLETFSLKIHFPSERITAISWKTTDGNHLHLIAFRSVPLEKVWCSIGAEKQGCFAEYAIAPQDLVSLKPKNLSFEEAASFPYVACTVWGALCTIARLHINNDPKLSVLLHAGSGGVGTFAVQYFSPGFLENAFFLFLSLAKAFNARVTATCSADAFDLLKSLGADNVVDYNEAGAFERLLDFGPYDIILKSVDTDLSRKSTSLLGLWRGSVNVDICNPLLRNTDDAGLMAGLIQSAAEFTSEFLTHALDGRISIWGYVKSDGYILDSIKPLVEAGKIKPVIHEIVEFNRLDEAMNTFQNGQMRGKIVVKM